ncbi:MAG: hypothetical protein HFJ34_07925 [Clostridia bacterium]|nr:hypothetical protein [Clostridia bacterium]
MEKQYEELLKLFEELEEGMTPDSLKKLTPEQLCYMIDEMAEINGKIAVLKNEEE